MSRMENGRRLDPTDLQVGMASALGEGGRRPSLAYTADIAAALMRSGAGASSTTNVGGSLRVTQTNHITVNGACNPEAVGRSVLLHQDYASDSLVRNMVLLTR